MRRIQIFVTRWMDREAHPSYLSTISDIAKWEGHLGIAVYGKTVRPAEMEDLRELEASGVPIVWMRNRNKECLIPRAMAILFDKAIQKRYDAVGVMDDDAYHADPQALLKRFQDLFENRHVGATGPLTQYIWLTGHHNRGEGDHALWEVNPRIGATAGMQVYRTQLLEWTRDYWRWMLCRVRFRSDFPMFMLADMFGFLATETYVPGWRHKTSGGSAGNEEPDKWRERRLRDIEWDHSIIKQTMRFVCRDHTGLMDWDEVERRLDRIRTEEVRYMEAEYGKRKKF